MCWNTKLLRFYSCHSQPWFAGQFLVPILFISRMWLVTWRTALAVLPKSSYFQRQKVLFAEKKMKHCERSIESSVGQVSYNGRPSLCVPSDTHGFDLTGNSAIHRRTPPAMLVVWGSCLSKEKIAIYIYILYLQYLIVLVKSADLPACLIGR